MQGRQFFFCAEVRRTMAFMLEGDRFGVDAVMCYRKKRVEFEIEYDLCVICLGLSRREFKKLAIDW
jgi:hypothetical protein